MKTFLVEDSPVIRENLVATLEELTALRVVGHAEDERGAIDGLRQPGHGVELAIIDLFLKSGSGLGVLRAVRQMPGAPRRVVLSNYATPDIRRQCLALGAERVFDKSHELDALIAYCIEIAGAGDAGARP